MVGPSRRDHLVAWIPMLVFAAGICLAMEEGRSGLAATMAIPSCWAAWRLGPIGGALGGILSLVAAEIAFFVAGMWVPPMGVLEHAGVPPTIAMLLLPVGAAAARGVADRSQANLQARLAAEARLREIGALAQATDALGAGVMVVGDDGTLRSHSPIVDRLCAPWEGAQAFWACLPLPEPMHMVRCERCGEARAQDLSRVDLEHPDGSRRTFELVYAGCAHSAGHDDATVVLLRDVTTEAQALTRVAEARDLAMAASKAKSTFLANMSHELRTPLTGILGYTEMLLDDHDDPETTEDLGRIQQMGQHLLGLISDILDLSKVEAGQVHLSVAPFSLAGLAGELESMMRPLAASSGNTFTVVVPARDATLHGDRVRLVQVLQNLLSNAFKFTAQGSVRLQARVEDASVVFTVVDTGVGISAEHAERLFDDFFQVDDSSTRTHEGAGLGLAICRHLVELMEGTIVVDSVPGEGSTFEVRVPRVLRATLAA